MERAADNQNISHFIQYHLARWVMKELLLKALFPEKPTSKVL